ncbi:hypothetical protein HDV01_005563 [Terramyces sp. JEL0728]|nr:hypothetical protein HDV01_005563 [Terramyces sp. JEL0728]
MGIDSPFRRAAPKPKRENIKDTVASFFPNLWMRFMIAINSLDFDNWFSQSSIGIVLFLNITQLTIKIYQQDSEEIVKLKTHVVIEDEPLALQVLELLLFAASFFNAIVLLGLQYKKAILFHQPTQAAFPESEYNQDWDLETKTRSAKLIMIDPDENTPIAEPELKWVMTVWNPSDSYRQRMVDADILAGQLVLDSVGITKPITWAKSPSKKD